MTGSVIHWFRKGLRLHYNPALSYAISEASKFSYSLHAVFVLDPWFVKNANVGANRWRFLAQTLEDLDQNLKKIGFRLLVIRGEPSEVFREILPKWKVKLLSFESDTEPYARVRDENIRVIASSFGVDVREEVSHTLYDPKEIIRSNKGATPLTYQKFEGLAKLLGPPLSPLAALQTLPVQCRPVLDDAKYLVPSLEELRVDKSDLGPCLFPGGETEALRRMEKSLERKEWIRKFSKPDTSPNSLQPSTTVLSPYLKFGCLSPRLFYHRLMDTIKGSKHTEPPSSLVGQLLWREFFYTVGSVTPNFDKVAGNPICKQIPWGNDPDLLQAWKLGQTGFPFIDAVMTQLKTEGWIHHLARHSVACFLTRGDLWQSWEEGVKIFDEYLLDADWSLNNANWMWLSCSAFFHQYYRVYSPIAFGKKTDKNGDYIKKYLPQLKKFPAAYIYEPWKAPLSVQKAAGCVIGKDYPKPVVDHDLVRERNLQRMSLAYKGGKVEGSGHSTAVSSDKGSKEATKRKAESAITPSKKAKDGQARITSFMKGK